MWLRIAIVLAIVSICAVSCQNDPVCQNCGLGPGENGCNCNPYIVRPMSLRPRHYVQAPPDMIRRLVRDRARERITRFVQGVRQRRNKPCNQGIGSAVYIGGVPMVAQDPAQVAADEFQYNELKNLSPQVPILPRFEPIGDTCAAVPITKRHPKLVVAGVTPARPGRRPCGCEVDGIPCECTADQAQKVYEISPESGQPKPSVVQMQVEVPQAVGNNVVQYQLGPVTQEIDYPVANYPERIQNPSGPADPVSVVIALQKMQEANKPRISRAKRPKVSERKLNYGFKRTPVDEVIVENKPDVPEERLGMNNGPIYELKLSPSRAQSQPVLTYADLGYEPEGPSNNQFVIQESVQPVPDEVPSIEEDQTKPPLADYQPGYLLVKSVHPEDENDRQVPDSQVHTCNSLKCKSRRRKLGSKYCDCKSHKK